jgi:hypothetical protein
MDQLIYRRPWLDRESAREAIREYINLSTFAEQGHCAHVE